MRAVPIGIEAQAGKKVRPGDARDSSGLFYAFERGAQVRAVRGGFLFQPGQNGIIKDLPKSLFDFGIPGLACFPGRSSLPIGGHGGRRRPMVIGTHSATRQDQRAQNGAPDAAAQASGTKLIHGLVWRRPFPLWRPEP